MTLTYDEWLKEYEEDLGTKYCENCLYENDNDDMRPYWYGGTDYDEELCCEIMEGKSKHTCEYLESYLEEKYEEYLEENGK